MVMSNRFASCAAAARSARLPYPGAGCAAPLVVRDGREHGQGRRLASSVQYRPAPGHNVVHWRAERAGWVREAKNEIDDQDGRTLTEPE
jgi:hypothetical protein